MPVRFCGCGLLPWVCVALSVCIPGSPHVLSVPGPVGSALKCFCYLNQFTPRLSPKLCVCATLAAVALTFHCVSASVRRYYFTGEVNTLMVFWGSLCAVRWMWFPLLLDRVYIAVNSGSQLSSCNPNLGTKFCLLQSAQENCVFYLFKDQVKSLCTIWFGTHIISPTLLI